MEGGSYGKPVRETNGKGDVELSLKDNLRKDCGVLKENTMREEEERCWNGGYMLTRSDRSGGILWGGRGRNGTQVSKRYAVGTRWWVPGEQ